MYVIFVDFKLGEGMSCMLGSLGLGLKIGQKPGIVWSLGPKAVSRIM